MEYKKSQSQEEIIPHYSRDADKHNSNDNRHHHHDQRKHSLQPVNRNLLRRSTFIVEAQQTNTYENYQQEENVNAHATSPGYFIERSFDKSVSGAGMQKDAWIG